MNIREAVESSAQRAVDLLWNIPSYGRPSGPACPPIVAHRGAWLGTGLIENTLPAFLRALECGAWGIEFDVRFTLDGVPVVHHDADLQRCHGVAGKIADLNFSELKKLAPLVPSLEDVLELGGLHLMMEIKTPLRPSELVTLSRLLSRHTAVDAYHVLTLNPEYVRIHSAFPEPAWVLVGDVRLAGLLDEVFKKGLGGLAGHYLAMTKNRIERLHKRAKFAGSGFAPNLNLYHREWARGLDWVFTNSPGKILSAGLN